MKLINNIIDTYNWFKYRLKKYPIKEEPIHDKFYLVWLWMPTWIYEMEQTPTYPHTVCYSTKSYSAWGCWALRREGVYCGIQHESVHNISELIRLGVIKL